MHSPDSIISTGSRHFQTISQQDHWRKLPNKLRIVKPIEGSLTLHHWQQLANPHLGSALEETSGIAIKGINRFAKRQEKIEDIISDLEEDVDIHTQTTKSFANTKLSCNTKARNLYNSTHKGHKLPSGFSKMKTLSSYSGEIPLHKSSSETKISSYSSNNIGLAQVLNNRHISGYLSDSTNSLDQSTSLTPSVISTPCDSRSFSPPDTPLNSPLHSPSNSPSPEEDPDIGIVHGFFTSLKTALYGESQKETRKRKRKQPSKNLGIMEKLEEVGVQKLMKPQNPARRLKSQSSPVRINSMKCKTIGQLKAPTLLGGSAFNHQLGQIPNAQNTLVSGRGPGKVFASQKRPAQTVRGLGVPATPGTGALQRQDLGSVPTVNNNSEQESFQSGFIGSITNIFFGRKGGLS